MSNYERKFANQGYGRYGRGQRLESVPQDQPVVFEDFSGGYNSSKVGGTSANSSPLTVDTRVDTKGRLRRAPGVRRTEDFAGRTAAQLAVHASLDNTLELILFDPPFIGVKRAGAVQWTDIGLPQSPQFFAWANHGSDLIFSNGIGAVWARKSGEVPRQIEGAPPARAYASFAGRALAGNAIIEGNMEPLGVRWSAANSLVEDWRGLGAGFELLLDDASYGDQILSFIPMGLDAIAVVMRNNIWVGRVTRIRNRPIDFRPVIRELGFVNRRVAVPTPVGVIGLSEVGVYVFDGNSVSHISAAIDEDLLPLDFANLRRYAAQYHPGRMEYWLFTPTETWVYAIKSQRWERRSLVALDAAWWSPLVEGTLWGQATGTWGEASGTWLDYKTKSAEDFDFVVLRSNGMSLGVEDEAEVCYFDLAQTPFWQFQHGQGQRLTEQLTLKATEVQYVGGGLIGLRFANKDGEVIARSVYDLPVKSTPYSTVLHGMYTGEGLRFQLDFGQGNVGVSKVAHRVLQRSERIETNPLRPLGGYPDYG